METTSASKKDKDPSIIRDHDLREIRHKNLLVSFFSLYTKSIKNNNFGMKKRERTCQGIVALLQVSLSGQNELHRRSQILTSHVMALL